MAKKAQSTSLVARSPVKPIKLLIEIISNEPNIIATATAACNTPTGLYEAAILPNSVTLSWNPVADASGYIVRGRKEESSNIYISD